MVLAHWFKKPLTPRLLPLIFITLIVLIYVVFVHQTLPFFPVMVGGGVCIALLGILEKKEFEKLGAEEGYQHCFKIWMLTAMFPLLAIVGITTEAKFPMHELIVGAAALFSLYRTDRFVRCVEHANGVPLPEREPILGG